MKKKTFKDVFIFLLCLMIFLPLIYVTVYAEDVSVEGITYEIINNEAIVLGYVGEAPQGELVIPETVQKDNVDYVVTKVGEAAFDGCENIESIILPDTIVSFGRYAFRNNIQLQSVRLSEKLSQMDGWAFSGCISLESIELPESLLKTGGNTFEGCISLSSVNIPSKIKLIATRDFSGCSSLKTIDIPSNITEIAPTAFEKCGYLTEVILHEGLQKIGNSAFENAQSLETLKIPSTTVNISETAFRTTIGGTESLPLSKRKAYEVHPDNPNYTSEDGVIYNKDKTELFCYPSAKEDVSFTIPNTVKTIAKNAFYYTLNLQEIRLSSEIFEASDYFMFPYAYSLKQLVIDDFVFPLETTGSVGLNKVYDVSLLDDTINPIKINRAMGYNYDDNTTSFVYCIEPEIEAGTFGMIVPSMDKDVIGVIGGNHQNIERYTTEVIDLVSWCIQGANVQVELEGRVLNREQSIRYVVAQSIVYEIVCGNYTEEKKSDIIDKIENDLNKVDISYGEEGIEVALEIMNYIDESSKKMILNKIPSFTNFETSTAPVYDYSYDKSIGKYILKLTDTNEVLENFRIVESTLLSNIKGVIQQNELILTSTKPIEQIVNISLEPIMNTTISREIKILYHPTDQIRILDDIRDINPIVHFALRSEKNVGHITIEKKVIGSDDNSEFKFMMILNDNQLSGRYGDLVFENGKSEFTLKHNEVKEVFNLPEGLNYTVTEEKTEKYTITSVNETGKVLENETIDVSFENTKKDGVIDEENPEDIIQEDEKDTTQVDKEYLGENWISKKVKTEDLNSTIIYLIVMGSALFISILSIRTSKRQNKKL